MKKFDLTFRFGMLLMDWLVLLFAFFFSYLSYFGTLERSDFPFSDFFGVAAIVSLLWLVLLLSFRVYALGRTLTSAFHFKRLLLANLAGVSAFIVVFFFWRHLFYSRLIIIYLFLFSSLFLSLSHLAASALRAFFVRRGWGVTRALIIGSNRTAERLIKRLQTHFSPVQPVSILDAYGSSVDAINGVPVEGKLNKLEQIISARRVDMIIQTDNIEHTLNLISFAEQKGIEYRLMPTLLGMFHTAEEVYLENEPVIRAAKGATLPEIIFGK